MKSFLRAAVIAFGSIPLLTPVTLAQGSDEEVLAELTTLPADEAQKLLTEFEGAAKTGEGERVAHVLTKMQLHDNPEFADAAKTGLKYKASKLDRAAIAADADELGLSKKERAALVLEREATVQAAAARLLANFPGKRTDSLLAKALKDKGIRREKPLALAAVIDAMGRTGNRKVEKDVIAEFNRYSNDKVMKAAVRYFGQIKTKDKGIVRTLCENLDAPEPGDPNSPTNPPASYWTARWKQWSVIRRDVSWALQQITGQVFKPAEGDKPGDSRKALAYIKEHAKELGLK